MLGTRFGADRIKTVGDITVELSARTTLAVKGRRALYLRILKVLQSCIPVPSLMRIAALL